MRKLLSKLYRHLPRRLRRGIGRYRDYHRVMVEQYVTLQGCTLLPPISMGYRSYANDSLIRHAVIGRFCSIGRRCSIGAASHAIDHLSTHFFGADGFDSAPSTKIGNDVWIGDNVVILAGISIGDGCVIGAGAVVTRDIPPYSIAVGVPARVTRTRFESHVIEQLLATKWWLFGDTLIINSGGKVGDALRILHTRPPKPLEPKFHEWLP